MDLDQVENNFDKYLRVKKESIFEKNNPNINIFFKDKIWNLEFKLPNQENGRMQSSLDVILEMFNLILIWLGEGGHIIQGIKKTILYYEQGENDCQCIGLMWMKKIEGPFENEEELKEKISKIKNKNNIRNIQIYKLY